MTYPVFDTRGAVDLGQGSALAALREARDAERERTAEEARILAWDRAMTRAFKGIFPRDRRMAALKQEHARLSREA
jgi:hypothetical protein